MSVTFDLYCEDCNRTLWIGQQGAGSDHPRIYKADDEVEKQHAFLLAHQGHCIRFVSEFYIDQIRDKLDEEHGQMDAPKYYPKEEGEE